MLHVSRATKMPLQRAALILSATTPAIAIMIENCYLFLKITSLADNLLHNYSLAHNLCYVMLIFRLASNYIHVLVYVRPNLTSNVAMLQLTSKGLNKHIPFREI